MTEPDVALTDYALTLLCGGFAVVLAREHPVGVGRSGARFFAAMAAASWVGGTVHGFARDESTLAYAILWRITLLCMGIVALALVRIAADLVGLGPQRWMMLAAVVYGIRVMGPTPGFWLAVAAYLPATLCVLLACLWRRIEHGEPAASLGAAAMVLSLLASALQQGRVGLHPIYFGHNALFHLIEAAALAMLFVCLRRLLRKMSPCTLS